MKVKNKTKLEALTRYIHLISTIRNDTITPAECLTLATMILLPEKHKYNPLSTLSRRYLMKSLSVIKQNLNNRIYSLEKNKYLYRDEDNILQINPFFKKLKNSNLELNVSYT